MLDPLMDKYDIPEWARTYIYRYATAHPIKTVSFAISLIDSGRRKGRVMNDRVIMPNGSSLDIRPISKLLNLFLYGEDRMARMEMKWTEQQGGGRDYKEHFAEIAEMDMKRAKAIKNLMYGLKQKVEPNQGSIAEVFDNVEGLSSWNDRVIATGIILRYSYAATFGMVFYRAFYSVAPEYMRSFGKAFKEKRERWDTIEAFRILGSGEADHRHAVELARDLLSDVLNSVHSNMDIAEEMNLKSEMELISEISIAHPFKMLCDAGISLDIDGEVRRVKAIALKKRQRRRS